MKFSRLRRARAANRAMIRARRSARRKKGNHISPTVEKRKGPGTGVASSDRRKRGVERRSKKIQQPVRPRMIEAPGSPWRYIVYFHSKDEHRSRRDLLSEHARIIPFIKTGFSGQYKVVKITPWARRKEVKLINYIKLAEESDLFTLMLCHREVVRKVFEIKAEEARLGL